MRLCSVPRDVLGSKTFDPEIHKLPDKYGILEICLTLFVDRHASGFRVLMEKERAAICTPFTNGVSRAQVEMRVMCERIIFDVARHALYKQASRHF